MSATDTIREFWVGRASVDGHVASRFHSEHDRYDLPAIAEYCAPGARVLDLGCGTCSVANMLVETTACSVHAVDYVEGFLRNAIDDPRLTTEAADVRAYRRDERFDAVLLLGVITYESADERLALYRNCAAMLRAGGTLFVKAQFGVDEEVLVDTFSDALGSHYRAIYPTLPAESELLGRAGFSVDARDPYPAALSPHANTHFHHLVATRR